MTPASRVSLRCGNVAERVSKSPRRRDARSRRGGLRADGFGEEEGDDAVSGVTADNAARVDDALVRGAYETANEREVLRGRKVACQRRRRFQVGHQNRRGATIGMLDDLHPFEMCRVRGGRCVRVATSHTAG